jgi:hypothetical protein
MQLQTDAAVFTLHVPGYWQQHIHHFTGSESKVCLLSDALCVAAL